MEFPGELVAGTLLKRYKRFLADVRLDDGGVLTAHCPNTGAMTGCAEPGRPVWLSVSDSRTRKYPHTWELVDTGRGMACIHSARANAVVAEAVEAGCIPALAGYSAMRREVKYGAGSRVDLMLENSGEPRCFVEVKSVTLLRDGAVGAFPDALSARARGHLRELQAVAEGGERAVIFFCALHKGIRAVEPARRIDPAYCAALESAIGAGVEPMAWAAEISPAGIRLAHEIPFRPGRPVSQPDSG